MATLQAGDLRHLGVAQGQFQRLEVAGQIGALGRRRDHRIAQLHGPGQGHLRRGCLMPFGDLLDHRVLQHFTVGQGHVRSDLDAMGLGKIRHGTVLQVRVQLHLVSRDVLGTDGGNCLLHQVDGEVGDADLAGQALTLGFQQLAHELGDRHLVLWRWPVDQGQV